MSKKLLILSLGLILLFAVMLPADVENTARDGKMKKTLGAVKVDVPRGTPILTEGFEGGALPTGWSVIQTNTDASATLPGWWTINTYDFNSGAYSAGLWWSYEHQDEWLISEPITLSGPVGANYYVSFWTYGYEGSTHDDHYYVKVSTDGGANWVTLLDLSTLTGAAWNDWAFPYVVDLTPYAGQTVNIAWHAIDCNDPGNENYPGLWYIWLIDDIEVGYEGGAECYWNPGDPHKMHFPQLPDEAGWDVMATEPVVLADDFMCMDSGYIQDVHWWGSWKNGIEGQIIYFALSLHEDIPADPPSIPYSRPGITLWEREVYDFDVIPIDPPTAEGWYDPSTGEVIPEDHQAYFQYNVCFDDPLDWYWQDSGTIYWLNISAVVADPVGTQWGWKSTQDHWNDDGVWAYWGELNWIDMWEPYVADPITNAFFVAVDPSGVFLDGQGDDAYGDGWYYYPMYDWWNIWFYDHPFTYDRFKTIFIEFDAFPLAPGPGFLELAVNWSTDIWSIEQPPGDSAPPLPGVDEDLYIGRQTLFMEEFYEGHYAFEYVIPDYNPEWVSVDVRGYNFDIPMGIIIHECVGQQSLDLAFVITGGGEQPDELDWGDCPDTPYPTLAINNGANHVILPGMFLGASVDAEANGQPSANALLDDNTGVPDDEDGVVFLDPVVIGNAVRVKVSASQFGFLDAWVDWNNDGDWADAGENVFVAQLLVPGVNILGVNVPAGIGPGTTFSRWRYSSAGGLPFDGPAPDGEVEDYRVFVLEPLNDVKWYQPPDLDNTGVDVDMHPLEYPEVDGLADDFLCTLSGPIIDIHFWGSFLDDIAHSLPHQVFEVTIYADIPPGVMADWSMPGDILWRKYFGPGEYDVHQITDNNPEDYFIVPPQIWIDDNHLNCYQYDFFIPEESAFVQEEGTIYWLGIRDITFDGTYRFGWKSCEFDARWNDDATWLCDPFMFWCEIRYPVGHEFAEQSLDLSFAITGIQGGNCCDLPGDANNDGTVNILDISYLIAYLYGSPLGPPPPCMYEGDANGNCVINILDISYLIAYLYQGGPAPICAASCPGW